MSDVYAMIHEVDQEIQERLVDVLEMRAADPRHRSMWEAYLSEVAYPQNAYILEIGCGTGVVSRLLAQQSAAARVVGIDPSPVFISQARTLSQGISNLSFEQGDGRSLSFEAHTFDVAVVHQALSHVPQPEQLIAEAFRILRPGGWLAVFDGDYATATVSTGENDLLEACVRAFRTNFIHDSWIVRRLPQLLTAAGFDTRPLRSHGYVEAPVGAYMLTWIERGADALLNSGGIGNQTAEALKAEARRRSTAREWFGHIAFASILGQKPA